MAQNRPPWLRLATQRFEMPARPVSTPVPAAPPPQAREPTIAPAPAPPRATAPAPVQASAPAPPPVQPPVSAPPPAPTATRTPAPPPTPTPVAAPARAPSPTPALAPVRPQRQVSQQTLSPPALRPAPPPPATPPKTQPPSPSPSQRQAFQPAAPPPATPPRTQPPSPSPPQRQAFQPAPPPPPTSPTTQPPSPSPPQRQAFQPAPPPPQTRTSPPEVSPPQASKSQHASPLPRPQLKGSTPPPQPQSLKTAQPPSSTGPPSPSPVPKPYPVAEIVKGQVIPKYPTAETEVKEADKVVTIKNVPHNPHVAAITDSGKRNHTSPQHSKINGDGNSGPGLHRNRIIPVRDDEDEWMRIIAISGENNGATMQIIAGRRGAHNVANGGENHKEEVGKNAAAKEGESAKKEPSHRHKPVSAMVNSNIQSVNNSIMYGCNCSHNSPGVHLRLHGKPRGVTPPP